jgi:hypothetical protein
MLVSPDKGRHIILGYERTINDGLMQMVCAAHASRIIPPDCLIDMLEEIADLRFGALVTPRACGFYSGPLFWDVFGYGGEVRADNVAYRMACQQRRFHILWIERDPLIMGEALRAFHTTFGRGCEDMTVERHSIHRLLGCFKESLRL